MTCLPCVEGTPGEPGREPGAPPGPSVSETPEQHEEVPTLDLGVAGASARREYDRRHAKREQKLEETWGTGRIGKVAKFLSDDPQTTKAWAQGARGEERLAKVLQDSLGESAVLLHDRKVPGTKGNIDHLVVASSGVWIVDAKRYKGKVERRDVGGFFKTDLRLYVGGRDRTKAVTGLEWQRDAVANALGEIEVPLHCVLSFVDAEWPLIFARPFQLEGVWVCWPKKLAELINDGNGLDTNTLSQVAHQLSERLPAMPK
ncbi:MAG: nuclease-related domain-containing protein [Microthrixaceae bacterium]